MKDLGGFPNIQEFKLVQFDYICCVHECNTFVLFILYTTGCPKKFVPKLLHLPFE
jgi:hypothetical protein